MNCFACYCSPKLRVEQHGFGGVQVGDRDVGGGGKRGHLLLLLFVGVELQRHSMVALYIDEEARRILSAFALSWVGLRWSKHLALFKSCEVDPCNGIVRLTFLISLSEAVFWVPSI